MCLWFSNKRIPDQCEPRNVASPMDKAKSDIMEQMDAGNTANKSFTGNVSVSTISIDNNCISVEINMKANVDKGISTFFDQATIF